MKTILSLAVALTAAAGSAFAQECPYSKSKAQAQATCQGAKSECASTCSTTNPAVAAFKKLDAKAQKEVATAMAGTTQMCPMGKRMPETMKTLDRLYAASIKQLSGLAKSEKAPAGFRKDVAAQLAMVTELSKVNKSTMSALETMMSAAASGCCHGEKECDSSCAEHSEKATTCDSSKGCAITAAESLCSSWKAAGGELAKFNKCEKSQSAMKQHMAVLAKHKIDVMPLVSGSFSKQVAMLKKGAASLACPKGGLMARNSEVMSACSHSKKACESTVKYMMAANKVLASMPTMGSKKSSCSSDCSSTKTECSGAKTECSSKTECSKSECSKAKTCSSKSECSSSKSACSKKCNSVKQ